MVWWMGMLSRVRLGTPRGVSPTRSCTKATGSLLPNGARLGRGIRRSCRRAGVAPRVVTVEEDVAARRIYPARVTQQPGMEVTTGLQGALRRWSILGKRADTVAMGWTARKTRTCQTLATRRRQLKEVNGETAALAQAILVNICAGKLGPWRGARTRSEERRVRLGG